MVSFILPLGLNRHGYEILEIPTTQTIDCGKEEKHQIICSGYRRCMIRKCLLHMFCVIFLFVPYLFLRWYPQYKAYFGHRKCSLNMADVVLIKNGSGKVSLHRVLVTPGSEAYSVGVPLRLFVYEMQRFVWNNEIHQFQLLRGLADDKNTFKSLLDCADGLSPQEQQQTLAVYGKNIVNIPEKNYWNLLMDEVLAPFFVFEIACAIFWCVDNYIIYSSYVLIISGVSVVWSLIQSAKQSKMLRDLVSSTNKDTVLICNKNGEDLEIYPVNSEYLVPGDLIVIPKHGCVMTCDALLLNGNCIVNESTLTGESVPVTKTPPPYTDDVYDPNSTHLRHTLYCGTTVIQSRYYKNNKVIAMVIRTGSGTAKGNLVRSILYPKSYGYDFYTDCIKFLLLMFIIAAAGTTYSIYLYIIHGAAVSNMLLRSFDIVTIVVPPALPAAVTAGIYYAQARLKKKKIFCTQPMTINICGKTKLVCFDKTGTLTEEGLDVFGVLPYFNTSGPADTEVVQDISTFPEKSPIAQVLATCHSLTCIENRLCGDPLDLSMFTATGWELEEPGDDTKRFDLLSPTVVRPKRKHVSLDQILEDVDPTHQEMQVPYEIGLIRQFPFSSSTQSMSVIGRTLGAKTMTVYTKGAPEKVLQLCYPETVPPNIGDILAEFTSRGLRVIAMAYKSLPRSFKWTHAQRATREEVETELSFVGLLLMQNKLKNESAAVIHQLKLARIKCVMVTGDNLLTSLNVSRECGILSPNCPVALFTVILDQNHSPSFTLQPMCNTRITDLDDPALHLAIDGPNWSLLQTHLPSLVGAVASKGLVFARMSPSHKTQIIQCLQSLDYIVAMVGDGANDCGALKAAHIGISLSQAEASIAAPFTSCTPNISCVLELVREGRCALVTSFGLFKYMALYSLVQFTTVIILYQRGVELSNAEFLFEDLVITTSLAVVMGRAGPAKHLVSQRPVASLVAGVTVIPLLMHIVVTVLIQYSALMFLDLQPWFVPVDPDIMNGGAVQCWENTSVFCVSCYQYFILASVFAKGKPHRQSFHTNWMFVMTVSALTLFTIYVQIRPSDWIATQFELEPWSEKGAYFRVHLLILPVINLLLSIIIENGVAESKWLKWIIQKVVRKKTPKNKYNIVSQGYTVYQPIITEV